MTAAHCIFNELYVHLGVYDQYCPPSICKEVEEYSVTANFTYGKHSDIALLKLDRPVQYKDNIRPICIILDNRVNPFTIKRFSAFGWGKMENGRDSQFLRTITVYRRQREECEPFLRKMPKDDFCAGSAIGDTCKGDSGGPLNAYVKHKRKWIYAQFGLVSYGATTCNFNAYYVEVMRYKMWIMEMVTFQKRNYLWSIIKSPVKL
ncbi:serine protease grass-like isoform X2 [Drosophila biarmipes]|nr:serine protease grass-like isoform X2 [Drosophila biarmipes]